jgi:hypothetical protein
MMICLLYQFDVGFFVLDVGFFVQVFSFSLKAARAAVKTAGKIRARVEAAYDEGNEISSLKVQIRSPSGAEHGECPVGRRK